MKKVVYFVGHYGGFLLCLLHKATYYKKNEAHFIYVKTYSSFPVNEFMVGISNKFIPEFGTVHCMDESDFWGMDSEETTKQKIIAHYNCLFQEMNVSEKDNVDIYINFDEFNSLGIYLSYKTFGKTVGIITTGLERLVSYVDMYLFNDVEGRKYYSSLQRKCRTLDKDGSYVTEVLRTFSIEGLDETKVRKEALDNAKTYKYFDLISARDNLSVKQEQELKHLFLPESELSDDQEYNMLLLSSNFTAFKLGTTEEEFIYGNQLLVDYCLGNQMLAVKPHPRADCGKKKWEEAFKNVRYIPSYLPAEYLENYNLKIDKLLSTGSTGSGYVSRIAKNKINFGRSYWFHYQYLNRVYVSLQIAAFICSKHIFYYGIPEELIHALIQSHPEIQIFQTIKLLKIGEIIPEESFIIFRQNSSDGHNPWFRSAIQKIIQSDKTNAVVAFINIEHDSTTAVWNNTDIKNQMIRYSIKKEKNKKQVLGNIDTESISLYLPDINQREKARKFSATYSLNNAGISLYVNAVDKYVSGDIEDKESFLINLMSKVNGSIGELTQSLNMLVSLSGERLQLINDFENYVTALKDVDEMIIISVRDTPGLKITLELAKKLQEIGLQETLFKKHWNSYIAILKNHKLIYEKIDPDKAVSFKQPINENDVYVYSAALKYGNASKVIIDEKDYSVNLRGINIVVYDCKRKKLLDSVCFDTHMVGIPCYRKKMKWV